MPRAPDAINNDVVLVDPSSPDGRPRDAGDAPDVCDVEIPLPDLAHGGRDGAADARDHDGVLVHRRDPRALDQRCGPDCLELDRILADRSRAHVVARKAANARDASELDRPLVDWADGYPDG